MQIHCARSAPSFCISPARKKRPCPPLANSPNPRAKNLAENRKSREVLGQKIAAFFRPFRGVFLIQMNSNKNQPHTISSLRAHTRASTSFRFSSSPFTPLTHRFVSQWVKCEGKAYFFLHLFLHPRNEGKSTFTEKSHFLFHSPPEGGKMWRFSPKSLHPKPTDPQPFAQDG